VLVGTLSADAFYNALFQSKFCRVVESFVRFLRSISSVSIASREGDEDEGQSDILQTLVTSPITAFSSHVVSVM
jgi:hypothetical protein